MCVSLSIAGDAAAEHKSIQQEMAKLKHYHCTMEHCKHLLYICLTKRRRYNCYTKVAARFHAAASLHQMRRWIPLSDISAGVEVVRSAIRGIMSLPLTAILTGGWHRSLQGHMIALATCQCMHMLISNAKSFAACIDGVFILEHMMLEHVPVQ